MQNMIKKALSLYAVSVNYWLFIVSLRVSNLLQMQMSSTRFRLQYFHSLGIVYICLPVPLNASNDGMQPRNKTATFVEYGKWECPQAQTQRKEVCVVDGDEGRAVKARKFLAGMSCDVTHGRGPKARRPEGRLNSKHVCRNASLQEERHKNENTPKCRSSSTAGTCGSFHFTCSHHTLSPLRHNSGAHPRALCRYLYYTMRTHKHAHVLH